MAGVVAGCEAGDLLSHCSLYPGALRESKIHARSFYYIGLQTTVSQTATCLGAHAVNRRRLRQAMDSNSFGCPGAFC